MIITNIEQLPGYKIVKVLGMVEGSTVRSKDIGRDIMASIKNMVGGEIKAYTELMDESRTEAMTRMIDKATLMGANAVINVRLTTASISAGAAEIYAYGTAVIVES